jgi:DNA-binding NarL/FixJ family response regulator
VIEAVPSGGSGGTILVYSAAHIIRDGVVGLLPEGWRSRTEAVADVRDLAGRIVPGVASVIVDGDAPQAAEALVAAVAQGCSTVLILGGAAAAPETLALPDAILLRDELEPAGMRLALAAGRAGMRLVPRTLSVSLPAPAAPAGSELTDAARRVLELLAEGMRDAEIARELHISESAVRKLVQRTVQALGARTRYQAVAMINRASG